MVGHSSDSAINKAQSLLQNMSHSASDDYLKHAHEFTKEAIGEFLARHEALHSQVSFDGGIRTGFTALDHKLGKLGKGIWLSLVHALQWVRQRLLRTWLPICLLIKVCLSYLFLSK